MTLAELRSTSSIEVDVLSAFLDSLGGDPLALAASIGSFVDRAIGLIPRSGTFADSPPPGEPDSIDAFADAYDAAAVVVEAIGTALGTVSQSSLPAALAGVTGASAPQVLSAVQTLVSSEAEGLRTGGSAFHTYAAAVRDARTAHEPGAASIRDGHRALGGISVDPWRILNPLTTADEVAGVLTALGSGVRRILDGVAVCHSAYDAAWEAGEALRRALSDANGYARLAGVEVPVGQTRIDVLVSRTAYAGDDPDSAVLSEHEWAAYQEQWASLSDEERERVLAAMQDANDPRVSALLMSALATGAGASAVVALAAAIAGADEDDRERLIEELSGLGIDGDEHTLATVGGSVFDQYSDTTCGSTALIALAAQSDPFLAYWLRTGELLDGHVPAYLAGIDPAGGGSSAEDRMSYLQQEVKDRANDLPGVIDYPGVIGTAPGGAARDADLSGTDYGIDWTNLLGGDSGRGDALTRAAEAANAGTPVPLLVGSSDNLVPQHYVLIVGFHDGEYVIYDPADGETGRVGEDVLLNGSDADLDALGGWNQVYAVVNPG